MSEPIQDYNPAHKSPAHSPHQTSTGVDLTPVVISPSRLLWRIEVFVYSAMLISASIAIFPFVLIQFCWPLLWSAFLLLIIYVLRSAWRATQRDPITLSVIQKQWRIKVAGTELIVQPYDEILVWSGVMVISVREISSGRKHRICVLPDSVNVEEWRRLRVWLRMGFR